MNLAPIQEIEALRTAVVQCRTCGLRAGCAGVVSGEGHPSARLVLCGGPGAEEDRQLRPFVGPAPQPAPPGHNRL